MTSADQLTIGAFARLVGLTPSALRFYDDCGLLRPREIDPQSGYRYYGHDQRRAAVLLRRTRELDLPLAQAEAVLAGPVARAAEIIRDHAANLGSRAERSARIAAELIAGLEAEARSGAESRSGTEAAPVAETVAEVAGPELAAAIRQVRDAGEPPSGPPRGVLLELDESGELAVVGDGPAWLAVRTLPVTIGGLGTARRLPVAGADTDPLAELGRRQDQVTLRFGAGRIGAATPRVVADRDRLELRPEVDLHPSHRAVFAGLSSWRSRVIMDRAAAVAALPAGDSVRLLIDHDHVEFHDGALDAGRAPGQGPRRVPAVCRGGSLTVAFATDVLAAALVAGVGPDVLLESSAPDRPVLVRSADQGSFTLLIMPQRSL